jgi:hypothetical protein
MITLTHTTELKLPMPVRSYIDGGSTEYNNADEWTKIAQIAYRVRRGKDLLPAFIEDINRHKEDPAYSGYEHTAKRSIASYIETLRSDFAEDISFIALPDKMSFTAIFQLLIEEILYRYWENDTNDGKVECHFDEVHYDYNEIASRYKGDADATRHFIKYISTPEETLRKIDVTESSIHLKNGWRLLAEKMQGSTIWSDRVEDERIYPGDEAFIHQFNEKSNLIYQYFVGVPPMPYSGNLLDAKVVILTLNPGYVENVNKDMCLGMEHGAKEQLVCLMRNALTFRNEAIYDQYDCSRDQGAHYWEKAFASLAMDAYSRPSTEIWHPIYHDIAFMQFIGYHSVKYKAFGSVMHMPSMIFTRLLAKYLATKTDKTFLVLRSETLWKNVFGEDLWNELQAKGRIITKGHKGMSQAITRGNIKKDNGYDKLVNILSQHA